QRADLVDLHQQRVGGTPGDAVLQPVQVGDEQVVADQLDPGTDPRGQLHPAVPVVLGKRVLDRHQRVGVQQFLVVGTQLGRAALVALELVGAVGEELGGRDV